MKLLKAMGCALLVVLSFAVFVSIVIVLMLYVQLGMLCGIMFFFIFTVATCAFYYG